MKYKKKNFATLHNKVLPKNSTKGVKSYDFVTENSLFRDFNRNF